MALDRRFLLCGFAYAIAGMGLGIYMAASHNHALFVAHAHMLLLGFVVSFIYALIHKLWLVGAGGQGRRLPVLPASAGGAGVVRGPGPALWRRGSGTGDRAPARCGGGGCAGRPAVDGLAGAANQRGRGQINPVVVWQGQSPAWLNWPRALFSGRPCMLAWTASFVRVTAWAAGWLPRWVAGSAARPSAGRRSGPRGKPRSCRPPRRSALRRAGCCP